MPPTAMALRLRPKPFSLRNSGFIHFFSSSASDSDGQDASSPSPSESQSQTKTSFSDVKASLQQKFPQQQQPQRPNPKPFSLSSTPGAPSRANSMDEIRKNLAEFRLRVSVPPPEGKLPSTPLRSSKHVSFQELYKRNVMPKGDESSSEASKGGNFRFDTIRERLSQLPSTGTNNRVNNNDPLPLSRFKESFKFRLSDPNVSDSPVLIGGSDKLPDSVFGKEMKGEDETPAMKTEFLKMYSHRELGEKLKKLRPQAKGQNWFSLEELNERLVKLREEEDKETEVNLPGINFSDLRKSLSKMTLSDEKARKQTIQRLNILSQIGGTPSYMLAPPKEHLVEKYFHPDNMSSAEKLKLELQKVRDEFKMSESDCGSARVQVATLTTKIKHLSTVLHKKDKHSRRGLQAMVQRRKKLLKYLRRTDWDSYCLVLSKLGLRDNPSYKTIM